MTNYVLKIYIFILWKHTLRNLCVLFTQQLSMISMIFLIFTSPWEKAACKVIPGLMPKLTNPRNIFVNWPFICICSPLPLILKFLFNNKIKRCLFKGKSTNNRQSDYFFFYIYSYWTLVRIRNIKFQMLTLLKRKTILKKKSYSYRSSCLHVLNYWNFFDSIISPYSGSRIQV